MMGFARQNLQAGQGFSFCAIDEENHLVFCVFVKCSVCGQIAVGDEQLNKVKSLLNSTQ
jgi:hypothetical protein